MKCYTYTIVISQSGDDTYALESGFLMANNYSDATGQLEYHYGPSLVRIVDLASTQQEIITLPSNIVYDFARGNYSETSIPCNQWGNKLTAVEASTEAIDWNVQETHI